MTRIGAAVLLLVSGMLGAEQVALATSSPAIQVGVWSQVPSATSPPTLPKGGLWVSSQESGPTSISALRIEAVTNVIGAAITIHVSHLTEPPSTPAVPTETTVFACAITTAWIPTGDGAPAAWSSRPTYDCQKAKALGVRSADAASYRFDLAEFVGQAGIRDFALVPGQVAGAVNGAPTRWPTFDATFAAPVPTDLTIKMAPPPAAVAQPAQATQSSADVPATVPTQGTSQPIPGFVTGVAPPLPVAPPAAGPPAGASAPLLSVPDVLSPPSRGVMSQANTNKRLALAGASVAIWAAVAFFLAYDRRRGRHASIYGRRAPARTS